MNFIDQANIEVMAGNGGNGRASFRREKFISKGGPDGGDGGDGGDVILLASTNQNSLATFRYTKQLKAESGVPGGTNRRHGKSGQDLIVAVPIGTEARDDKGNMLADLIEEGQTAVIALGGKGGFGNAHFVSSRRQAPNFAEKGEPGESKSLSLELKMLADVGLVGLPNAGKSTLLGAISNAKPKIANYPFTTLNPSVGVVDVDKTSSLLFADIPGLIEGAAEGKGLGHEFLRHIERTSVVIHVIDAYGEDIAADYQTVRKELAAYRKELARRPEIVALNKTEGLDDEIISDLIATLKAVVRPKYTPIIPISAKSRLNLRELVIAAKQAKDKYALKAEAKMEEGIYEYSLPGAELKWQIKKGEKGVYVVSGEQIERFAQRTDFNNDQAVARLRDILRKRGVLHALIRSGLKPGDIIRIADKGEIDY